MPRRLQMSTGEVADGGHGLVGAFDGAGVLAEHDIAQPVQRLYRPMSADVGGDGGGVGVGGGQAGDTEYRDCAQWGAVKGVAVALQQEDLFDVWEQAADVVGRGQD